MDIVAVIIIDYQDIAIATAGQDEETAGEIGCDLASDKLAVDKDIVRPNGGGTSGWWRRQWRRRVMGDGVGHSRVGSGLRLSGDLLVVRRGDPGPLLRRMAGAAGLGRMSGLATLSENQRQLRRTKWTAEASPWWHDKMRLVRQRRCAG
jgi:hypothetical protein